MMTEPTGTPAFPGDQAERPKAGLRAGARGEKWAARSELGGGEGGWKLGEVLALMQ